MRSLICVVIGDGHLFVVETDDNKMVAVLKDMIKEKNPSLIECEARRLTLYAANKDKNWKESGGDWLKAEGPYVELLKQGGKPPPEIEEMMDLSRELNPAKYIRNLFTSELIEDNVIHVLVQLPEDERRQKRLRTDQQVDIEELEFTAKQNYVDFMAQNNCVDDGITPRTLFCEVHGLDIAGLSPVNMPVKIIYCRQDTRNMVAALNSMENGIEIFGPPGIGKSITTWLWACNQVKNKKTVLWIHVSKVLPDSIVRLSQSGSFRLCPEDSLAFIRKADDDIVVIDGVTNSVAHIALKKICFTCPANSHRQAVSVASLSFTRGGVEDAVCSKISSFDAIPWTLEEYYEATRNEKFFQLVQPFLGVGNDKEEQIDKKYYVAGCSARWMFDKDVLTVVKEIEMGFKRCSNVVDLLKGVVGHENSDMVNHLACDRGGKRFFTSQYVSRMAIETGGDEIVRLAYGLAKGLKNSSFTGWVVEMDFIQQIKNAKGKYVEVFNEDAEKHIIEVADYALCDMKSLDYIQEIHKQDPTMKALNNTWLLPN